jgi:predicted phage baseplate assembly protein
MKTPITVFGNVLQVTRGESVFNEILGNGDARVARQSFKLKKKPLTYFFDPSVPGTKARSTLEVRADDVLWREVRSFFGTGPQDRVYIVRHDDDGNTFLTFGDGVRGARLPSGIRNVRATYRFGSGEAAPPAGAIKQLARAVKGLRRVESPIAAIGGKDPDPPQLLRTSAPQSVLIFERAVSTLDFEALANLVPGVIRATAEFAWIEAEQEAGVVVTYLGSALPEDVLAALRQQAEPGLPLVAKVAVPKARKFVAEVEVDPRFDKDLVAEAVRAALVDPESGPLATRNAPIGQRLFRSVLFDVIHAVPGVASITSAVMKTLSDVTLWDFRFTGISSFATFPGPCAGAGYFYDFADGERVLVSAILATAPVLGSEARDAR